MNPEVIIISKKHEPALNHLHRALREQEIDCKTLVYSREALEKLETKDFKGFFIFCLPPAEITAWLKDNECKFLNHFNIYHYDHLVADKIDHSLFLMFDYMITGMHEYKTLVKHLRYLKINYWRKIPTTKLGLQRMPASNLIDRLFRLLESLDVNTTDLEQVSKKLHVNNHKLQKEIKQHLNLQYCELKSVLVKHYEEFF